MTTGRANHERGRYLSKLHEITVRPFSPGDAEQLELFRAAYPDRDAELLLPHGFMAPGVETAVAVRGDAIIASVTSTLCVILDPLIRNPESSPEEIGVALTRMEAVLAYVAKGVGAREAYIAIPDSPQYDGYCRVVERRGYERNVENCRIFRKSI